MAYELKEWNLNELNTQSVEEFFGDIEKITKDLESKKELFNDQTNVETVLDFISGRIEMRKKIARIYAFYALTSYADNTNQQSNVTLSKIGNFLTNISNRLMFFSFWFKDLNEEKANEIIEGAGIHAYYLKSIRKDKPYTLTEKEEKIITIKDTNGSGAISDIYEILTNQFEFDWDGEKITQSELLKKAKSPKREIRVKAMNTLLDKYMNYKDVIAECYKHIVMDGYNEDIKLRGYKSPISSRNHANDLPDEVIETLHKVIENNTGLFKEYFKVKQKILGLEKFDRFDMYAPLSHEEDDYDYDYAINLVLEAFERFSNNFKENALKIIESDHIHGPVQKNKRGGAFCYSPSNDIVPYILTNYQGRLTDISTIAHELGHGIHSLLASKQSEFTSHAPLPLAETASIFSEMLLSDLLMEKQPEKKQELIVEILDDAVGSILRQFSFSKFEQFAHDAIVEGKTYDEISQVYLENYKHDYGFEVPEKFKYEWMYIPHLFGSPFYVYAYAFGQLLTLSLYELYKEQGESFVPKIEALLAAGGSDEPVKLCSEVGIDITSEEFWQKGFDVLSNYLEELKKTM